jgi:hypothetical protein
MAIFTARSTGVLVRECLDQARHGISADIPQRVHGHPANLVVLVVQGFPEHGNSGATIFGSFLSLILPVQKN